MEDPLRQPAKLQKRKSREQQELLMSGGNSGQPANTSQPLDPVEPVPITDKEKDKKSKWRMSNPFHSKDKSKDKDSNNENRKSTSDFTGDSAYASSEPNTSGHPSLTNNARDQMQPPPVNSHTPVPTHDYLAPPQQALHGHQSQESLGRETYRDIGTGNMVTVVTTTTTTTTTTTGPGGSTTVEQPTGGKGSGNITNTSGPSPPHPVSPQPQTDHQYLASAYRPPSSVPGSASPLPSNPHQASHHITNVEEPSPAIPNKSNIRNRMELDSVSPAIQRPNPMEDPVSPISAASPTRANFSYPARQPPQGVPRQIPGQYGVPEQHPDIPPIPSNLQTGDAYNDPSHPAPLRVGHHSQKQGTVANLKAAAHGIHGAGETLRGTFSDVLDGHNSTAHAKNQAIINAGRSEIEAARFPQNQQPAATEGVPPPVPPKEPYMNPPPTSTTPVQRKPVGSGVGKFMKKMKEGPLASNRHDV